MGLLRYYVIVDNMTDMYCSRVHSFILHLHFAWTKY